MIFAPCLPDVGGCGPVGSASERGLPVGSRAGLPGSVDHSWLRAPAAHVAETARTLLGWEVAANGVRIRLTEVEAYAGTGVDPASHAHRGPTPRTTVMFGPAGHAYTYFVFGMHWCLNVVCGGAGEAAAVLLRAGEVVEGVDLARKRRGEVADRDLARGLGVEARGSGWPPRTTCPGASGSPATPRSVRTGGTCHGDEPEGRPAAVGARARG